MNIADSIVWLGIISMFIGFSCLAFIQVKLTIGKSMSEAYSAVIWKQLNRNEKKIAIFGLKALAVGLICFFVSILF